jgi:hypothetical protein
MQKLYLYNIAQYGKKRYIQFFIEIQFCNTKQPCTAAKDELLQVGVHFLILISSRKKYMMKNTMNKKSRAGV